MPPAVYKLGDTVGEWTIIGRKYGPYYICRCSCGIERDVFTGNLRTGKSQHCGSSVHYVDWMLEEDRLYTIWTAIKQRCYDPNHKSYAIYGGRGIDVCPEWKDSFKTFYEDMKSTYETGLTIERIDNSKGYNANNCKWITRFEQSQNRRPRK